MTPNDFPQFSELLSNVLAFHRQDMSKFALGVWWQACQPFTLEQVAKALTAHALDPELGKFPPKPSDLMRLLQGTHTDRSLIAWGKVMEAMQRVGGYTSVGFDDPAIHAAIEDMGGWPLLCQGELADLPFLQKRFCDAHKTYASRKGLPYPPVLIGRAEAQNRTAGRRSTPPVLIGDPVKAQAVIAGGAETTRTPMLRMDVFNLLQLGAPKRPVNDDGAEAA